MTGETRCSTEEIVVEYYQCICGRHTRGIVGTKRLSLGLCLPCYEDVKNAAQPLIKMEDN